MIKSMTGFGRGSVVEKGVGTFVVEMQSVNRKYVEFNINLPREFIRLESKIRDLISKRISRGRVNV
ncbi:YicC/YloC family endoribonuclease, partial [Candidatus Auribacterota bacterium]